jgi:hypothetical protein
MPTRFPSGPYDAAAPPTSIKTLHETIMAKLGEQLRSRYEPAQQLPPEMRMLVDRLDSRASQSESDRDH